MVRLALSLSLSLFTLSSLCPVCWMFSGRQLLDGCYIPPAVTDSGGDGGGGGCDGVVVLPRQVWGEEQQRQLKRVVCCYSMQAKEICAAAAPAQHCRSGGSSGTTALSTHAASSTFCGIFKLKKNPLEPRDSKRLSTDYFSYNSLRGRPAQDHTDRSDVSTNVSNAV